MAFPRPDDKALGLWTGGGDGLGRHRAGEGGLRAAGGFVTWASPTQRFSPCPSVFGAQLRPQIPPRLGNICSK